MGDFNEHQVVPGLLVDVLTDEDKGTDRLTRGVVRKVLTRGESKNGIKVELVNGMKGRVEYIPSKDEIRLENFKFYNRFFYLDKIYSIWDLEQKKYLVVEHKNKIAQTIERVALLFDSQEKVKAFIKDTPYVQKNFSIRAIKRHKPIHENFKTLNVEFFSVNGERKLSITKLMEWERKFKSF